jgi:mono/diheme cytochrome c family protein
VSRRTGRGARQAGRFGLALLSLAVTADAASDASILKRGEYVFRAAGCENCHTDRQGKGEALAGGRRLATPLGTFVAPNITPDLETGIGGWSEPDLRRALRAGVSPRGEHYYPSFPYTSYTRLGDGDIAALYAYLRARPAVRRANEPHELPWYLRWRPLLAVWKRLYFEPGAYRPVPGRSASWNRGAYLALAAAHCGECHTPRNRLGGFDRERHLAGTREGPEGGVVPNITPDRKTGIGRWRKSDLVTYFEIGMDPDGDFADSLMAEFIDNGLKHLTQADREALAEYLLSVPPVEHALRKEKKKTKGDEFGF